MAAGSAAGTGVRAAGGYAERKLVTPAFEDAGSATIKRRMDRFSESGAAHRAFPEVTAAGQRRR